MPYIPKIKIGNTEYNLKDTEARTLITNTNTNLTNTINSKDTAVRTLITNTNTTLTNTINSKDTAVRNTIAYSVNLARNDIHTIINTGMEALHRDWNDGGHLTGLYATVEKTYGRVINASLASGSGRGCALLNATDITFHNNVSNNIDKIVLGVSVVSQQYYVLSLSFSNTNFGKLVASLLGPDSRPYEVYSESRKLDDQFRNLYFNNDATVNISYKGEGEYSITISVSNPINVYQTSFTLGAYELTVNGAKIGLGYQNIGFTVESGNSQAALTLEIPQPVLDTPWANKNWFAFGDTVSSPCYSYVCEATGLSKTNYTHSSNSLVQLKDMYTEMIGTGVTPHLITILAGVYDFINNAAISDVETGLRTILEGLYTAFPRVLIVVITPFPFPIGFNDNTQSKKLADYAHAIKAVAEEYLAPCLDLYSCSGVNSFNVSSNIVGGSGNDPGALTASYAKFTGNIISQFISKYVPLKS